MFGVCNHSLGAVEHPRITLACGAGFDMRQGIESIGFLVSESGDQAAIDNAADRCFLDVVAAIGNRATCQQSAQKGFDDQTTAQRFKDHRQVKACTAQAAIGFSKERAQRTLFGVTVPHFGAEAVIGLGDALARRKVILLGNETLQNVCQHAPIFSVFKIYARRLIVPKSSWI
jgi:hypothetical protein